ncbi:MAG: CDP-alcohol phosphatidyltransferase family protein [Chloroflexi bacterium]|nr:CDP-alcohol phosphatidyltransferase family protein [Chloroflexota bacterium]
MFPQKLQAWARKRAEGIAGPLARYGVTPNAVTVLGFVFNVLTAVVLASGHLSWGGALLFLSGLFDMLDGALARITSRQSTFGAFLDSLLDRYSEAAILLALIFVFNRRGDTGPVLLVYAVAIGSVLSSYARARAEGLGLECKVGIAPRPERVLILGLGLLFNGIGFLFTGSTTIAALAILAFLTHFTALQRLLHVWRQTHRPSTESARQPSKAKGKAKASETRTL